MEFLADDALEGRAPGTRGHELAARYLRAQLREAGISGALPQSEYFQWVHLERTLVQPEQTEFTLFRDGISARLRLETDYLATQRTAGPAGQAPARLVFVGYGVTAPELNYDDYQGLDVRGAVVVALAFAAPPSFPSTIRAHYSDFDVKASIAASHGAIGFVYVRSEEEETRFPWAMLIDWFRQGRLRWLDDGGRPFHVGEGVRFETVLSQSGAEALFADEKQTFKSVLAGIQANQLSGFSLEKFVRFRSELRREQFSSPNVIGFLEGSDPVLKNESVVFTAHSDHLGIGRPVEGDAIYNGAADNAAGCAVLLEVARAFSLTGRPRRSVVFAFVTAEETGLLGSDFLARHPPSAIGQVVANINVDGGISFTPVGDVIAWGAEHSSLGEAVARAARESGLTLSGDPFPEEGTFVRSDNYSFVKQGVPSVFVDLGFRSTQPGVDALALVKQWLATKYHSPKDDLSQPLDYESSERFAKFVLALGQVVASEPERPRWKDGDFFGGRPGR
ncbi:MAG: M20/M25/M40 family metallo-hydrolase [Vicinamibacterales bacterium]